MRRFLLLLFSNIPILLILLLILIPCLVLIPVAWFWQGLSFLLLIGLLLVNYNLNYSSWEKRAITERKKKEKGI